MTFWINQHLIETKESILQWRTNRNVSVMAEVDHIEIAPTHFVLGLHVGWENRTTAPMEVVEMQVVIYKRKEEGVLTRLLPMERFVRANIQRALQKTPISQFSLPPKELHTEHIRFLSHGHLDIEPGTYTVDIQIRDADHNSYTRRVRLDLEKQKKYRVTED